MVTIEYEYDQTELIFDYFKFKQESGIYFIHSVEQELLYIGKTIDIRNRIMEHLRGYQKEHPIYKYKEVFYKVKVIYCDYTEATCLEPYFIKKLEPTLNSMFNNPTFKEPVEISEEVKREYKERSKNIQANKFRNKTREWAELVQSHLKNMPNKSVTVAKAGGGAKFKKWIKDNWEGHADIIRQIFHEYNIKVEVRGEKKYRYFTYLDNGIS